MARKCDPRAVQVTTFISSEARNCTGFQNKGQAPWSVQFRSVRLHEDRSFLFVIYSACLSRRSFLYLADRLRLSSLLVVGDCWQGWEVLFLTLYLSLSNLQAATTGGVLRTWATSVPIPPQHPGTLSRFSH